MKTTVKTAAPVWQYRQAITKIDNEIAELQAKRARLAERLAKREEDEAALAAYAKGERA